MQALCGQRRVWMLSLTVVDVLSLLPHCMGGNVGSPTPQIFEIMRGYLNSLQTHCRLRRDCAISAFRKKRLGLISRCLPTLRVHEGVRTSKSTMALTPQIKQPVENYCACKLNASLLKAQSRRRE